MTIGVFGVNHRTAPLEVRERLSVTQDRLPAALRLLAQRSGPAVILSTCNRTEFYMVATDTPFEAAERLGFLEELYSLDASSLERYFYVYHHDEAVRHLFRVVCGLDSMIVGEEQILGQVRDAFGAALAAGTVEGLLSKLFQHALRVGKRVRRETRIGRTDLSVSKACVQLARQHLGSLRERRALVLGAGEAGRLAARALRQGGISHLLVTNRTLSRARALAEDLGGQAVPFSRLEETLAISDVVISSTEAPGFVLTRPMLEQTINGHANGPLVLLDIAVPRDIDPSVRSLPNVALFDVDDLAAIAEAHRHRQEGEIRKVETLIEEEVGGFLAWWAELSIIPVVASLRQQAEALRQREVARAMRRLSHLNREDQEVVQALSRGLVEKLLHDPITTLKAQRDPAHLRFVKDVFKLSQREE
ncbi:MAG: glutamyl-tRNA reductase [Chloroflexi bacterium]|nr:glutamyl-tRNA reductase [Chloroflexota bacterium]